MAMKKITRRWLVNGLGVIFVILLGVMIAFSFGVRSFYYSSVQQIIISRSAGSPPCCRPMPRTVR
ncbi:MAG: hypothetical protein V8Q30_06565 [Acutalibacteraceae bacterium]